MKSTDRLLIQTAVNLLESGHPMEINARGYSMFPILRPNQKLVIEPINPTLYRKGDIVVFIINETLIAHRIVWIDTEKCLCRGDATLHFDGPISINKLLGKVTHRKKQEKTIQINSIFRRLYGHIAIALYPLSAKVFIKMASWHSKVR